MKLSETIGKLDRAQKTTIFKVIASCLVLALAITAVVSYATYANAPERRALQLMLPDEVPTEGVPTPLANDPEAAKLNDAEAEAAKSIREGAQSTVRAMNEILAGRSDWRDVGRGVAFGTVIALVVIWLGLGLTYVAMLLLGGLVIAPLYLLGKSWAVREMVGTAQFLAAGLVLTACFAAAMQGLRALFSGPWAVLAIARNVVQEAVRMKVSLVFIVMLIFALAALPGLLDAGSPLRYRVQSFLQYGSAGSFWIIAILTLFLAAGTVAFEQRDRIIWQTMTKPVASWQYLLGKWLGVSGVAAVLLLVSAAGVFLFTEYLRNQPAQGEVAPYVVGMSQTSAIAEDRLILETQVLSARASVRPTLPDIDPEALNAEIDRRLAKAMLDNPAFVESETTRGAIKDEIMKEDVAKFLAIEPGQYTDYLFDGLQSARQAGKPITLRYRINAGANTPTDQYRISFQVEGSQPMVRQVFLAQTFTLPIAPAAIREDGSFFIRVANGDAQAQTMNKETMSFPPDGFEVFYPVSSYNMNYLRVVAVMWFKLAMLAMLAIWASTFLSFPVACLVAFGVFFAAEGSGFILESLDSYATKEEGQVIWHRVVVTAIALPVAKAMEYYADLKPTADLVEGRLMGWRTVAFSGVGLGAVTGLFFAFGSYIFRRRELATYSGS